MKGKIVGIAGRARVGKDTTASIMNYILTVGVPRAKYEEWITKQKVYDEILKERSIHCADLLKDICSSLFGIERKLFDDGEYKDHKYYWIEAGKFLDKNQLPKEAKVINIQDFDDFNIEMYDRPTLSYFIKQNNEYTFLTLRTILQYFGTNICREQLFNDIWIKATMAKATNIANTYGYCFIPDIRFKNEADAVTRSSLYRGLIEIERNVVQHSHSSENIDFHCSTVFDNNGTKMSLFYKCLEFVQNNLI